MLRIRLGVSFVPTFFVIAASAEQPAASGQPAGPKEEFARIEEEMERAYEEYRESRRERLLRSDGEDQNAESAADRPPEPGHHPEAKPLPESPPDPRTAVLARMDALADRTADLPEGGPIAVKTFIWSAGMRLDPANLLGRLDRVARHPAPGGELTDALSLVPGVYNLVGEVDDWITGVRRIGQSASDKAAKAASVFVLGQLHMAAATTLQPALAPAPAPDPAKPGSESDGQPTARKSEAAAHLEAARRSFGEVQQRHPDSEYAGDAKQLIYEIEHLQPGMAAPAFSTTTLLGEKVSLADHRGKVVLLDFWATWCPPCMAETATLSAAAERFANRPFVILTVSLDDFREMLESTLSQKDIPGIHTWDESGRDNPISELYNAQDLPTWYLIDADGLIRARNTFGEKLIPAVESLLQEGEPGNQGAREQGK